jgi:hypothetical protein
MTQRRHGKTQICRDALHHHAKKQQVTARIIPHYCRCATGQFSDRIPSVSQSTVRGAISYKFYGHPENPKHLEAEQRRATSPPAVRAVSFVALVRRQDRRPLGQAGYEALFVPIIPSLEPIFQKRRSFRDLIHTDIRLS